MNKEEQYKRNLSFKDLLFVGLGFIIGAGIFSLLPFIIKYSKGISWLSFVVGGMICIFTGMSYAKLNSIYSTNDAEYTWILKILNFKEDRENPSKILTHFANIVIWIVMAIGLFTGATIVVSQAEFIRQYANINKILLILLLIIAPTIINLVGNKYTTIVNKTIMYIILTAFTLLYILAAKKGKHFNEVRFSPKSTDLEGILKSSFITIFAYNGFQSVVQLSEETKNKNDVPKGILGSITLTIIIYALIVISIISILGVKKATSTITPFGDAFDVFIPGNVDRDLVNMLAIIALTNTSLIVNLSRSRLLQKLSQRGIAPKFLSKLTSIKSIFGGDKTETFKDTNEQNNDTIPIYSIIAVSVVTFFLTFIKKGAIEYLAKITNGFIFIIFSVVNILTLIYYFKTKNKSEKEKEELLNKEIPLLKGFPWYAILGLLTSLFYLSLSRKYLNIVK